MALRNYPGLQPYRINSLHPTGRVLGSGAYGEVVEAKIPGAVCAVKKMHSILEREVAGWVDQEIIAESRRKFVHECELMSRLRHPHIVQFLGIYEFSESDTPALVTELLLTDLHSLLLLRANSPSNSSIPLVFKLSFLRDVARGLVFLHSQSPPIVHRDLTARNILLSSAMVAKIADLGVARLIPQTMCQMTKGPGNAAYMPPEAQGNEYNESIDVFSFGVLCLFTLTQTFPDPLTVKYQEGGKTVSRTEIQRRSVYIQQARSEVESLTPVIEVIEQSLHDNPQMRPISCNILSHFESAEAQFSEGLIESTKLEIIRTIESEREENKMQKEQREREFQSVLEESQVHFVRVFDEQEVEHDKTIKEMQREQSEVIAQEKVVAAEQREREIIAELSAIIDTESDHQGTDDVAGDKKTHEAKKIEPETRAVMIIGSDIPLPPSPPPSPPPPGSWLSLFTRRNPTPAATKTDTTPAIQVRVPLAPLDGSDDTQKSLAELGIPMARRNNQDALLALYDKTDNYDVFSVHFSRPGVELSRCYILEQVKILLKTSKKKTRGAILHYYGNGRQNTGDWCFRDGYITFNDIAELYMTHSRGRVLNIVPDCHSSGRWVSQCAEFLDQQGVKACGHSAKEKGILLKVYASCRTGQDAAELSYNTRAMVQKDDGYVYHYTIKKLSDQQHTHGVDFTSTRCGREVDEECGIAADATWSKAGEVLIGRIYITRGRDRGSPAWHYILLDDDAEKIKDYKDKTQGENAGKITVNVSNYGEVIKSGWGKDPPPEVKKWAEDYGYHKTS